MARTLTERLGDWRWWGEQVAHALLGALCALIIAWATPVWASWAFGTVIGLLRELIQNWGDRSGSPGDSIADALFWSLGSALASLVC